MKKLIALLLALTLVMGLAACNNNDSDEETTTSPETTADTTPTDTTPADTGDEPVDPEGGDIDIPLTPVASNDASTMLTNIWNGVPEDKRFFAMGGDFTNIVDGAPGVFDLKDEGLTATLLVPADQIANLDQAASLMHAMMANNFTAGMFHVTGDAAAFAETMHGVISNNPWICGMPEKMLIAVIDGEYVLTCFGINDCVGPFETALGTAYPNAEIKYNEAIAG